MFVGIWVIRLNIPKGTRVMKINALKEKQIREKEEGGRKRERERIGKILLLGEVVD